VIPTNPPRHSTGHWHSAHVFSFSGRRAFLKSENQRRCFICTVGRSGGGGTHTHSIHRLLVLSLSQRGVLQWGHCMATGARRRRRPRREPPSPAGATPSNRPTERTNLPSDTDPFRKYYFRRRVKIFASLCAPAFVLSRALFKQQSRERVSRAPPRGHVHAAKREQPPGSCKFSRIASLRLTHPPKVASLSPMDAAADESRPLARPHAAFLIHASAVGSLSHVRSIFQQVHAGGQRIYFYEPLISGTRRLRSALCRHFIGVWGEQQSCAPVDEFFIAVPKWVRPQVF
jgi:hypothetical protein